MSNQQICHTFSKMTRVAFFQKAVLIYYLETKYTVLQKKTIFYHQYEL